MKKELKKKQIKKSDDNKLEDTISIWKIDQRKRVSNIIKKFPIQYIDIKYTFNF